MSDVNVTLDETTDPVASAPGEPGPALALEPIEPMAIYFDMADNKLWLGKHYQEMLDRISPDEGKLQEAIRSDFRLADETESRAYWVATVLAVREEVQDFQERMSELTGHTVSVQLVVHTLFANDYGIFDAAASVDGLAHHSLEYTQWREDRTDLNINVVVYGPRLSAE